MQHQRQPHRLVRPAGNLRARGARRRRQRCALHARDVDAGALEQLAVLEHASRAAAAFRPLPAVSAETLAVGLLQRGDDAPLHLGQE